MSIKRDWLWDIKISANKAKKILQNHHNPHFIPLASLLLSRNNSVKEVFNYLKSANFLENWNKIKRQMRKNAWNDPRIDFWQAIYDNLRDKYKKNKLPLPKRVTEIKPQHEFCKVVADKIAALRKQKGLSQKELAKKLKVSQQVISRIESGRENISLLTIKRIVESMGAELHLEIL